jgi:hypothetical protein
VATGFLVFAANSAGMDAIGMLLAEGEDGLLVRLVGSGARDHPAKDWKAD